MQVNPRTSFWINVALMIFTGIGGGAVKFTGLVPAGVDTQIVGWSLIVAFVLATINTGLHGFTSPAAGPLVAPKTLLQDASSKSSITYGLLLPFLLIILGTMAFAPSRADAATLRLHAIVKAHRVKASPLSKIDQIVANLEGLTADDLKSAISLASASGDANGLQCYEGLSALVTGFQTVNTATLPKVHLITTFEKAHIIAMQLRAGAPLRNACAPLADEVKSDATTVIAQIAAGTFVYTAFGI